MPNAPELSAGPGRALGVLWAMMMMTGNYPS